MKAGAKKGYHRRSRIDIIRQMLNILCKRSPVSVTKLVTMMSLNWYYLFKILKPMVKAGIVEQIDLRELTISRRQGVSRDSPTATKFLRITEKGKRFSRIMNTMELMITKNMINTSRFGEGDQHAAAVQRIMTLLMKRGATVYKDKKHVVNGDRVDAYYPDITAEWAPIIIEVNGHVGHSSKLSYDNEQNQKAFFESIGSKFFTYSPTEIAGRGWINSKGKRHTIHTDAELLADWGL